MSDARSVGAGVNDPELFWHGVRLKDHQTPLQLDMDDDDTVFVPYMALSR